MNVISTSIETTLYWNPPAGSTSYPWDDSHWCNFAGNPETWQTGDIAVFDTAYTNGVTTAVISGGVSVSPSAIEFDNGTFDLKDDGSSGSEILISDSENLVVYVPSGVTATIASVIQGASDTITTTVYGITNTSSIYGTGSLTKEGPGTLVLVGTDGNYYSNYWGGTYIDAGTVRLGSSYGLGDANFQSLVTGAPDPDPGDVTIDDGAELDLYDNALAVSALNSSTSGIVTDSLDPATPTALTIYTGGTPSVFGGSIDHYVAVDIVIADFNATYQPQGIANAGGAGLLFTLTGSIVSTATTSGTGSTQFEGILHVGDGTTNGSLTGPVTIDSGDLVFNVVGTETFDGWVADGSTIAGGAVVKTGGGTLDFSGVFPRETPTPALRGSRMARSYWRPIRRCHPGRR